MWLLHTYAGGQAGDRQFTCGCLGLKRVNVCDTLALEIDCSLSNAALVEHTGINLVTRSRQGLIPCVLLLLGNIW